MRHAAVACRAACNAWGLSAIVHCLYIRTAAVATFRSVHSGPSAARSSKWRRPGVVRRAAQYTGDHLSWQWWRALAAPPGTPLAASTGSTCKASLGCAKRAVGPVRPTRWIRSPLPQQVCRPHGPAWSDTRALSSPRYTQARHKHAWSLSDSCALRSCLFSPALISCAHWALRHGPCLHEQLIFNPSRALLD